MRSRSWNAQRNGVNAPRSIDVVRSEERRVGKLCDWSSDVCSSDLDLAQRPGKGLGEFAQPGDEIVGYVGHQAADARHAGGEPGAGPHLLEIVDALALLERPEKRGERAEVDRRGEIGRASCRETV